MSDARERVLAHIRQSLAAGSGARAVAGPRSYRRSLGVDRRALVALFADRVADYDVTVRRSRPATLAADVAAVCAEAGVHRLGVPLDLPEPWRPEGVELVADDDLSSGDLDALDGALTGCLLAIAETGTIVLDSGEAQGRRALTLVPDLHLCVVGSDQVVGTVPEAFELIGVDRPVTFVSGPSATSDIELRRVRGVHGPRRLDVFLVAQR
jgi:L-lactate dehydrogenase complex protein LldG